MNRIIYFIVLALLFAIPFVVMYYHQWINRHLKNANLPLKTPDILNIYLIFAIHWFSRIAFNRTWIVFLTMIMALIGIGLVVYNLRKDVEIIYSRFFRVWWRAVFLVAFVMYLISGIAALISVLI